MWKGSVQRRREGHDGGDGHAGQRGRYFRQDSGGETTGDVTRQTYDDSVSEGIRSGIAW